jgi:hypothetical protein
MSQGDYIRFKRVSTELRIDPSLNNISKKMIPYEYRTNQYNQPIVFNASDYEDYKDYNLETMITNTKPVLNRLTTSGKQNVWNMDKPVNNCPSFILCRNTNTRPNRTIPILNSPASGISQAYAIKYLQPYQNPVPPPLNIKQQKNTRFQKNACNCAINKSYSQNKLCSCRTGDFGIVR